jgi:hypothetical protein
MKLDRINRRTHLYAALFFLPWFFVYGLSSVVFSHPRWFEGQGRRFNVLFERPYRLEPAAPGADLRAIGDRVAKENGLDGHYAVFLDPQGNLSMYKSSFWQATDVKHDARRQMLTARTDVFRWSSFLTRMHARGGFERPGFVEQSWSVLVDIVQAAILIWIASGIYMWWHLKHLRKWGFLALGGGVASFAFFLLRL